MAIFMILILPNHEHEIFFHLLVSSLISLRSGLWFSLKTSFTFLVSFIPSYFILFVAIVNGSSLIIWLSVCLLFVFRHACDFWTLILSPKTLLKLLIKSGDFGLRRWGLLDIQSCHLQIETIWLPPFLFEYPLFLFLAWLLFFLPEVVRKGILV